MGLFSFSAAWRRISLRDTGLPLPSSSESSSSLNPRGFASSTSCGAVDNARSKVLGDCARLESKRNEKRDKQRIAPDAYKITKRLLGTNQTHH